MSHIVTITTLVKDPQAVMSEFLYRLKELQSLTPAQIKALEHVACRINPDHLRSPEEVDLFSGWEKYDNPDEQLTEFFNLLKPCTGCVPEEEIGDDLFQNIRHKFDAVYASGRELAEEKLQKRKASFLILVDPSYEDCTWVVVLSWKYDGNEPFTFLVEAHKAWNFVFPTLQELADKVLGIAASIVEQYRTLVPLFKEYKKPCP